MQNLLLAQHLAQTQNYMLQMPQINQPQIQQQIQQMQQIQHIQQIQQMQQAQYNQMNQFNQLVSSQMYNPMLINQLLMQQYQKQEIAQQIFQMPQQQRINHQSSSRTIQMDEQKQIKQEDGVVNQVKIFAKEPKIGQPLDIEAISSEIRVLVNYLSQEENPKQSFIDENIKILPQISQQIVDIILERHQSQTKTKEEQIKFVLRKCFKFLKNNLDVDQGIITPLDLEKKFYKVYFEGEEEMIPFRKNSNMKTMNSQYLRSIFSSENFVDGFREYLTHFDEIWEAENEEKVDNMVKQVIILIQQNRIGKLHVYRRLPWVASIKNKCKILAQGMLKYAPKSETKKKIITEDNQIIKEVNPTL